MEWENVYHNVAQLSYDIQRKKRATLKKQKKKQLTKKNLS